MSVKDVLAWLVLLTGTQLQGLLPGESLHPGTSLSLSVVECTIPVCDLVCSMVAKLGPEMTQIFSTCKVMNERCCVGSVVSKTRMAYRLRFCLQNYIWLMPQLRCARAV